MINLAQTSLLDILPPNLRSDPTVAAAAQAMDAELRMISAEIDKLNYISRMGVLTSEEADELAWQFHVDFYDSSLPLEQRRELIKNSDAWHRRKGTPSAVEELIATIFGDGRVEEWWEFGGTPYTFRVLTNNSSATGEQAQQFLSALNSVKRLSARLESIQITATDEMNFVMAGVLHIGDFLRIRQVV